VARLDHLSNCTSPEPCALAAPLAGVRNSPVVVCSALASSLSSAASKSSGATPLINTPLTKSVGVPLTPSLAPRTASSVTSGKTVSRDPCIAGSPSAGALVPRSLLMKEPPDVRRATSREYRPLPRRDDASTLRPRRPHTLGHGSRLRRWGCSENPTDSLRSPVL
jgi:hypothetical protein